MAGLRTPFTKAGTGLRSMRTLDLATSVVKELIARTEIAPREITLCVYGQVVPTLDWLNIAREVVLTSGLPKDVDAFSVSRACATSIQAMTDAAQAITAGHHDVAIVGGADSMSDVPLGVSRPLRDALMTAQRAKTLPDRLGAFGKLGAKDLVPPTPGFSREPTTGELMGEAAEKMAKENGITREEQVLHRAPVARQCRSRVERRHLRCRSHARDPARGWRSGDRRQRRAQRLEARVVLEASAGVRQGPRNHHRRQLFAAHRRRERAALDERVEGQGARIPAARVFALFRVFGRRPRLAAAHGPSVRAPQSARARRSHPRPDRSRRYSRSIRSPTRLEPQGARVAEIRARRARRAIRRWEKSIPRNST